MCVRDWARSRRPARGALRPSVPGGLADERAASLSLVGVSIGAGPAGSPVVIAGSVPDGLDEANVAELDLNFNLLDDWDDQRDGERALSRCASDAVGQMPRVFDGMLL